MHALDTSSQLNVFEIFSHLDASGKKAAQAQKHTQANAIYAEAWHILNAVHNKEDFSRDIQIQVIDFLSRYARCLSHCALHTRASQIIDQALSLMVPNKPEQEARIRQIAGYIYKAMGRLEDAEKNYLHAQRIHHTLKNFDQEAYVTHHLSIVYERMKQPTKAIACTHQLVEWTKKNRP